MNTPMETTEPIPDRIPVRMGNGDDVPVVGYVDNIRVVDGKTIGDVHLRGISRESIVNCTFDLNRAIVDYFNQNIERLILGRSIGVDVAMPDKPKMNPVTPSTQLAGYYCHWVRLSDMQASGYVRKLDVTGIRGLVVCSPGPSGRVIGIVIDAQRDGRLVSGGRMGEPCVMCQYPEENIDLTTMMPKFDG
jgi:hypothetical protein